jgi:rsbT co-antagonist protein RsbR
VGRDKYKILKLAILNLTIIEGENKMAPIEEIENLLKEKEAEIIESWMKAQLTAPRRKSLQISDAKLREESINFLHEFIQVIKTARTDDITAPEYHKIVAFLKDLSKSRALLGFTPRETVIYIFGLKDLLLPVLQKVYKSDAERLVTEVIRVNTIINNLGLVTIEEYTKSREQVIKEQAVAMLEMSSPIVTLWEKVLAVPLIGTLDSNRTQIIMESLLKRIIETGSNVAIIDVTGVVVIDTQVASYLLKTVSAVRLIGSEAVITGIRPEIAQTIVNLGVDLSSMKTRASLAEGLMYALNLLKYKITKG